MIYLEYEELEVDKYYYCQLYNREELVLRYLGDGRFESTDTYYSLYGDIRYVLNKVKDAV